jgi:hypothetical protein
MAGMLKALLQTLGRAWRWTGHGLNIKEILNLFAPEISTMLLVGASYLLTLLIGSWSQRDPFTIWLGALAAAVFVLGARALLKYLKSDAAPAHVAVGTNASMYGLPDWPIHNLFFHVHPKILDQPHLSYWEVIGRRLLDQLSIGRLRSWGRPYQGSREETERHSTLVEIPQDYWAKGGDFSYMFFAEQFAAHTNPPDNSGWPEYADVQLNKAQALNIAWPTLSTPQTISLMKAATDLYAQTRGTVAATVAEGQGAPDDTVKWYCHAIWARTQLFGCREPDTKLEEIPHIRRSNYSFHVENGEVVLQEWKGGARFLNLQILSDRLPRLVEVISEFGEGRKE